MPTVTEAPNIKARSNIQFLAGETRSLIDDLRDKLGHSPSEIELSGALELTGLLNKVGGTKGSSTFGEHQIDLETQVAPNPEALHTMLDNIPNFKEFHKRYEGTDFNKKLLEENPDLKASILKTAYELWVTITATILKESDKMEGAAIDNPAGKGVKFLNLQSHLLSEAMDDFDPVLGHMQKLVDEELEKLKVVSYSLWNGNPAKNLLNKHHASLGNTIHLEGLSFGQLTDNLSFTKIQEDHPMMDMSLWAALSRGYVRMVAKKLTGKTTGLNVFISHNGNEKGFTLNIEYPALQGVFDDSLKIHFHAVAAESEDDPDITCTSGMYKGTCDSFYSNITDFKSSYGTAKSAAKTYFDAR